MPARARLGFSDPISRVGACTWAPIWAYGDAAVPSDSARQATMSDSRGCYTIILGSPSVNHQMGENGKVTRLRPCRDNFHMQQIRPFSGRRPYFPVVLRCRAPPTPKLPAAGFKQSCTLLCEKLSLPAALTDVFWTDWPIRCWKQCCSKYWTSTASEIEYVDYTFFPTWVLGGAARPCGRDGDKAIAHRSIHQLGRLQVRNTTVGTLVFLCLNSTFSSGPGSRRNKGAGLQTSSGLQLKYVIVWHEHTANAIRVYPYCSILGQLRSRLVSWCKVLGCHIGCHMWVSHGVFGY
jgi:hypothetical protein